MHSHGSYGVLAETEESALTVYLSTWQKLHITPFWSLKLKEKGEMDGEREGVASYMLSVHIMSPA